jgi:hypothetical protein
MKFEVFTAVKMRIVVFWVVMPCSLVGLRGYYSIGRTHGMLISGAIVSVSRRTAGFVSFTEDEM